MRILDLHADLGWNIRRLRKQKEKEIIKNHHLDHLIKGEVLDCAAACFFNGSENWKQMQEMILWTKEEIQTSDVNWILQPSDLKDKESRISFIMTVEGMCGIKTDVREKVDWMYRQGVRIGSLEWNDENALATGLAGNPTRGLTSKGIEAIEEMNHLHMIVDVSHANEHTFWDVVACCKKPFLATHSNAKSICNHRRNLTDEQIMAIASKGGIIGLNSWNQVISTKKNEQNAKGLAKHAKYIKELVGVEHIACGFDFMDYYPDVENRITNIDRATKAQNFIKALQEEGFANKEIKMIAYQNAHRFLKENM